MSFDTESAAALYPRIAASLSGVRYRRNRFRDYYDRWLGGRRLEGAPQGFIHAVVVLSDVLAATPTPPDPADDATALALALAGLQHPEEVLGCLAAAVASGVFDTSEEGAPTSDPGPALLSRMRRSLGEAETGIRAMLQSTTRREGLTTDHPVWTDPGMLLPAIITARRRLCRITAEYQVPGGGFGKSRGTGFLVGPSAVLTAFHVVQHVPDPLERPKRLRVRFDFSETTGLADSEGSEYVVKKDWCLARGELDAAPPAAADWWQDLDALEDWFDLAGAQLDFAVLALDGTPGLQRGWYDMGAIARDAPAEIWAMHHPDALWQTITRGDAVPGPADAPRIFHKASTVEGSSGGLLLNEAGAPVGLHYLGIVPDTGAADRGGAVSLDRQYAVNVGVPLRLVADRLKAEGRLTAIGDVSGVVPHRGCLDGRIPLFGRANLLKDLDHIYRGENQILMVHAEPRDPPLSRPGKSFTISIIENLFRPPENLHIVLKAGDFKADARRMAARALEEFAEDLVAQLPASPDTTTPAYVQRLVASFGQVVRERMGNRRVWIHLDDLDKHDLSDASGREFLATLYNQITQHPDLRIVLIGLPPATIISGLDPDKVTVSPIPATVISDLQSHIVAWMKLRGAHNGKLTDESLDFLAGVLTEFAGAEVPLQRLAFFVSEYMTSTADAFFGSAVPPEPPAAGGPA